MGAALVGLVLATAAPAVGDVGDGPSPPAPAPAAKPWANGVSVEDQATAQAMFEEGNTLFAQLAHAPALEKYRAALKLWDHPLIRFNLAVTEIRLDRVLEAAVDLEAALRFGEAPFKPELYQQALDYRALIRKQVGHVAASCTQAGATILLDGKRWFGCPGGERLQVMAGEHTLVGELPGYIAASQRLIVTGGGTAIGKIDLVPLESAVKLVYRTPRWIPWTITGGGAVLALVGLGVWSAGRGQMETFDDNFKRECSISGCEKDLVDHPSLRDQKTSAELKGAIGISLMVAGGAVAIGGAVFVLLNRPTRVLPTFEVAPTAGGMTARAGWRF